MKIKTDLILGLAVFAIFVIANSGFSQDQAAPTANQATETQNTAEPQWVWAEVTSVDAAGRQLNIKYLDYETDTEKEISLSTDDSTTYENVKSLDELKPQETVSIDYIITADGKNLAKNINVEKSETTPPPAGETVTTPPAQAGGAPNPAEAPANTANNQMKPEETGPSSNEQAPSQM